MRYYSSWVFDGEKLYLARGVKVLAANSLRAPPNPKTPTPGCPEESPWPKWMPRRTAAKVPVHLSGNVDYDYQGFWLARGITSRPFSLLAD